MLDPMYGSGNAVAWPGRRCTRTAWIDIIAPAQMGSIYRPIQQLEEYLQELQVHYYLMLGCAREQWQRTCPSS